MSKIWDGLSDLIGINKTIIDKEARNIAYKAKALAEYLCLVDENYICYFEYNTAFYEELFLLSCIEAVKLINNKIDSSLYDKIKASAFIYSNNFDGIKKYNTVKAIVDNAFLQRSMFYMSLINTYNYRLNKDFFTAVLDYQASIFSSNTKKPETKEKIKNILDETLPALIEFYNSY